MITYLHCYDADTGGQRVSDAQRPWGVTRTDTDAQDDKTRKHLPSAQCTASLHQLQQNKHTRQGIAWALRTTHGFKWTPVSTHFLHGCSIHAIFLVLDVHSSSLHRRVFRKRPALPRPMAWMIFMTSPGCAYLCPFPVTVSPVAVPSPRFSSFPCSSSPRAPRDAEVILAHTPVEGRIGEGGCGGLDQGDARGALDGCRVRRDTRVHGWKHLRHVTSDIFKGNTTQCAEGGLLGLNMIIIWLSASYREVSLQFSPHREKLLLIKVALVGGGSDSDRIFMKIALNLEGN